MKESEAIIERIRSINRSYQYLDLAVDDTLMAIKPGQSFLARLGDTWDPYLRDQWWPVGVTNGKLVVERPAEEVYEAGQVIPVLGLVGKPYRFRRTLRNVLLLAHDTPPTPLLLTIPWLLSNKISVTIVLTGSAAKYDSQHLPAEVEIVRGDEEFEWPNQVMTIGWADQVFVVVAQDDERLRFQTVVNRFRELRSDIPKNYIFGVFQPPLPCGAGACSSCMLRTMGGTVLVCTDGPAFDLSQVRL